MAYLILFTKKAPSAVYEDKACYKVFYTKKIAKEAMMYMAQDNTITDIKGFKIDDISTRLRN